MGNKLRSSASTIRDGMRAVGRKSVAPSVAPVTTVRVKVVGEAPQSAAAAKKRFSKTLCFEGALPNLEDSLPHFWDDTSGWHKVSERDVKQIAEQRDAVQEVQVPSTARPDSTVAQDAREPEQLRLSLGSQTRDADLSTTLRVKALKPGGGLRARRLWQSQTPLVAFCVAATFCVLCVLAVNAWAQ